MQRALFIVVLASLALPAAAQDWIPVDLSTTVTLRAFEQRGNGGRYLVGDRGYAARSNTLFTDWTTEDVGTTADLLSVYRVTDSVSWISGRGGVARIRDNGGAWDVRDIPDATEDYVLISPLSTTETWAAGSGGSIWETTDEGVNWMLHDSGTATALHAGFIVGGVLGYVVGDGGLILRSTASGETWIPLPSGTTENLYAIAQIPVNGSSYVVVGANGTILITRDGGATWTPSESGTSVTLRALSARTDLGTWLAVGDDGTVLRSFATLMTWCTIETGVTTDLYAALMVSPSLYFVAGENGVLLRTETDGGGCVAVATEPEAPPAEYALSAVWPNPVRERATLTLRVDRPQRVTVEVLDVQGRRVAKAFGGEVAAGAVVPVALDLGGLASGTYVVRVRGEGFEDSRQVVVLR
jgi:photosystem II stability/assembly factor-like uncharacterized protein